MEESQLATCNQSHLRAVNGASEAGHHSASSCKSYHKTAARVLAAALLLLQLASVAGLVSGPQTTTPSPGQRHSIQVFTGNRSIGVQLLEARRRLSTAPSTTTQATISNPQFQEATVPAIQVNNSVQGQPNASLHFGAKVALAILSFVILLVASATLFDHRLSLASCANRKRHHLHGSLSSLSSTAAQSAEQHQAVRHHQPGLQNHLSALRDQRSPSLSSSSSCSTLLCSIVSSTTPILSCGARHTSRFKHQAPHQASGSGPAQLANKQVPWLRLLQLIGQRSLRRHSPTTSSLSREAEKREPEVIAQDEEQWRDRKCDSVSHKLTNCTKLNPISGKLCQQLLLAFSLKQTTRQIFNRPARYESRDGHKPLPPMQTLLPSKHLLPVMQGEQHHSDQNSLAPNLEPKPCIESLHGLRCLSMIWIIVVHSYHFALKSLFAPPGPTNLYKTIVSQLLANGSFACDSFFFAAGFLLAYLALPAKQFSCSKSTSVRVTSKPLSESQAPNEQQLASHQQDCDSISSLSSTSHPSTTKQLPKEMRTQRACTGAPNQNQQHRYHLNNIVICNNNSSNQFKLTDKSCCTLPTLAPTQLDNNNNNCNHLSHTNEFTFATLLGNLLHRYIRMMPLMMAIIGLSASLLRYLGEGPLWEDSTLMYDKWCRKNWWINVLFIHNFLKRENMCLSHSWYAAVDIQLFTLGQLILFVLFRNKRLGLLLCTLCLFTSQLINGASTLIYHLPAVPLVANFSEQTMNLYYGLIYIKPYCRASPYLIGILLAFLMRRTPLSHIRLSRWQVMLGWTLSMGTLGAILLAMRPAMNGSSLSELESALYSSLSRPLWACAIAWMIYACITGRGGPFASILEARCFFPLSQLSYPAFLIHPIVIAIFYGSHQAYSFQFSHYLMLYIIIGNIVITYASAFVLSALFEFPLLSLERTIKRAYATRSTRRSMSK